MIKKPKTANKPEAIRFIAARNAMLKAKADYDAICKETPVAFQNEVLDAVKAMPAAVALAREQLAAKGLLAE